MEPENHFLRIKMESKYGIHFICIDLLEFYVISPYIDTERLYIHIKSIPFRFHFYSQKVILWFKGLFGIL